MLAWRTHQLFALAGGANAENLQWFSNQYDKTTILAYGMPETDYVSGNFVSMGAGIALSRSPSWPVISPGETCSVL